MLDKEVTPAEYRVLSYLAWRQGQNGQAWPSQETIATDLHVSRRHIQTTIKRLGQSGYLIVVKPEKQGRGHHLRYALGNSTKGRTELHPLSEEKALRASPFTGKRAQKGARKGRSPVRTNTIQEHYHTTTARSKPMYDTGGFDSFWQVWPKKKAKLDAIKAWEKLNPSGELVDRIIAAVEFQKQSRDWLKNDGQYIPYPATWLNGQRWTDEVGEGDVLTREANDADIESLISKGVLT